MRLAVQSPFAHLEGQPSRSQSLSVNWGTCYHHVRLAQIDAQQRDSRVGGERRAPRFVLYVVGQTDVCSVKVAVE